MTGSIYKLDSIPDDPRFGSFAFVDKSPQYGGRDLYAEFTRADLRMASNWKERAVSGDARAADFIYIYTVPAFGPEAANVLGDVLTANGELLPVTSESGTFYAYHLTNQADVLDKQVARVESVVDRTHQYAFFPDRLSDQWIFKIPELPRAVFVTQQFVERVRDEGLQGFRFRKVWPLADGEKWFSAANEICFPPRNIGSSAKKAPKTAPSVIGSKFRIECPIAGPEADAIATSRREYPRELGIGDVQMDAEGMQAFILKTLSKVRSSKTMSQAKKEDRAFWLAVAWAECVVENVGWRWAILRGDKDAKNTVIADPTHAYFVPVIDYFTDLALGKQEDVTTTLLYNMIKAGNLGGSAPGALKVVR